MTDIPPVKPPQTPEAPRRKGHGLAVASLVLGICAFIPLLGFVCGLIALILGIVSLTQGREGMKHAITGIALGVLGPVIGYVITMVFLVRGAIGPARVFAHQATCQANLYSTGKAIALYTTSQGDEFPRMWGSGDPNEKLDSSGASTPWGIQSRNGMNNVWLLIDQCMVSEGAFQCPSDDRWEQRRTAAPAGWTDAKQFSYGIHWPYEFAADGQTPNPAFPDSATMRGTPGASSAPSPKSGLAILADRNPGGSVTSSRPPANHSRHGCAVLYLDYSVQFYKSTSDSNAGANGDDIYVNDAGAPGGLPQSATDTSITPAGP